ncbi:ATP-binding protein [Pseudomonas sp. KU26590]|uniref:hypothetical protein n=1 Tax=Pseudomonas sp. KU26590 TaxID=2991051 RepID=UPI00223D2FF7|nr:hypothetical protein [Pseudomonas sp. KU26590]UZJ58070.1 ATP-binding protein [Pseudomonas sp. KU26590]
MNYLLCPKQYQAEQSVVAGFSADALIILGGETLTGKTTVARRLLKNADRARVYTAYVPGIFTTLYGDVTMAFVSALGLPLTSQYTSFRNIERSLRDMIGDREFRLVFDDAGVHFGGGAKQRNAAIKLMQALLMHFPNIKLMVVSGASILDGPFRDIMTKEMRYVDISVWQYGSQYRSFINKVGQACGFKRSQFANEEFAQNLLERAHGASGALIQILQTLAKNPRYKFCPSLPADSLRTMWKF